ncbi:MAG: hypothetical protein MI867_12620 [Pseudomonadales bacterium]|nr:hypothetical protein [Pseudomonadales bacterium]
MASHPNRNWKRRCDALPQFRATYNLTQAQAATLFGVHPATWCKWESALQKPPTLFWKVLSLLNEREGFTDIQAPRIPADWWMYLREWRTRTPATEDELQARNTKRPRDNHINQREAAQRIGVSVSNIESWESPPESARHKRPPAMLFYFVREDNERDK